MSSQATQTVAASPFRRAWRDHRVLLALGLAFVLFSIGFGRWAGAPWAEFEMVGYAMIGTLVTSYVLLGTAYGVLFLQTLEHFIRQGKGFSSFPLAEKETGRRAGNYMESGVFAYGLAGVIAWLPCTFLIMYKSLIPFVTPYKWDPILADIDRALHFGRYPYEWLNPLIDRLHLAPVLDATYLFWFVVMMATCTYVLFFESSRLHRMRFMWCYALAWIVGGSFLAMMFSSVGPLFFHEFYPALPDIFAPLLAGLNKVNEGDYHLLVFSNRDAIVEWTRNIRHIDPNGLSAMPSLHIWTTWLILLYWKGVNRAVFAGVAVFNILLLAGTVYMGPHYAIDGYVAILLSSALWWATGLFLRRAGMREDEKI